MPSRSLPALSDITILRSPTAWKCAATSHLSPMPARLRVVQRSLAHSLDKTGVLYCPSCGIWRRALSTRPSTSIGKLPSVRRTPLQIDSTSTRSFRPVTSSPFITAGKTVPPRFRELYDALSGVQDAAIEQVSITRLQLALRGLESEAPLIRAAGECLDLPDHVPGVFACEFTLDRN